MALVFNTLPEKQKIMVGGKWFEFGPEQIKLIHQDNLAYLLCTNKAEHGFVEVPDVCLEAPTSPEAIEAKAAAKQRGIQNRINFLNRVVHNLEVGMKRDLEQKNIKADVTSFASEGELAAIRELVALKTNAVDAGETRANEFKKLKEQLNASPVSTVPRSTAKRD